MADHICDTCGDATLGERECAACRPAITTPRIPVPDGFRLVLMSDELFRELGGVRIVWGEPDEYGVYSPTMFVAAGNP